MKTIQQTLKELDIEEVIDYYFATYPIELFKDLDQKWDNKTVAECKEHGRSEIRRLIERLINMEPNPNVSKKSILYASKIISEGRSHHVVEGLVDVEELLKAEDVSDVESYGYEFEWQEDTLGYYVADTALTQNNLLEIVVSYLFEVSFFGIDQEHIEEEKQLLDEAFKQCEDPSRSRSFNTIEELYEDLGITPEEVYSEEEEKRNAYQKAIIEYDRYCKAVELERIKKSILSSESFKENCDIDWDKYTNFNESHRALDPVEYVREMRDDDRVL